MELLRGAHSLLRGLFALALDTMLKRGLHGFLPFNRDNAPAEAEKRYVEARVWTSMTSQSGQFGARGKQKNYRFCTILVLFSVGQNPPHSSEASEDTSQWNPRIKSGCHRHYVGGKQNEHFI